jgi:hypothetical protein
MYKCKAFAIQMHSLSRNTIYFVTYATEKAFFLFDGR